jgi:flagella basal body P-ring formation protein FlgA
MSTRSWPARRAGGASPVLATVLAAALATAAVARAGEVAIDLRAEVLLDHPHMTLADLAVVGAADEGLRQVFSRLPMGHAPLAGYVERRSRAELDLAVRAQAASVGQVVTWRGADSVKIRTESQSLDNELIFSVAKKHLLELFGPAYGDMEIRLASPLAQLSAPAGEASLSARAVDASRLRGRMAVWVDVTVQGALYRSVLLPLIVTAQRQAYVARRALPAGALAGSDDFVLRPVALDELGEAPLASGALVNGVRLRRALAAGQVVGGQHVASAAMVLRGDRVRLLAAGRGIAVETSAYAQADGMLGQAIQVRPERSNETVSARVIAAGVVGIE